MNPPRPPEEVLRRVVRLSRLNGWSVVICGGVSALLSLGFASPIGVLVSLLVTLGGALEVHGQRRLTQRAPGGVPWLVRAQIVVLVVIWVYAARQLLSFDGEIGRELVSPRAREMLDGAGLNAEDVLPLVRQLYYVLYAALMAATLIYQGGLALYYRRCAAAVEAALQSPPLIPAAPPHIASGDDFAI